MLDGKLSWWLKLELGWGADGSMLGLGPSQGLAYAASWHSLRAAALLALVGLDWPVRTHRRVKFPSALVSLKSSSAGLCWGCSMCQGPVLDGLGLGATAPSRPHLLMHLPVQLGKVQWVPTEALLRA
jgi:hypothetical protein